MGVDLVSLFRLFADDSLENLLIKHLNDCLQLQRDLDKLVQWAKDWQMQFNPSKCYVLRITRKKNPIIFDYKINGHTLESVESNPYMGIKFTTDLNWGAHIKNIVQKANNHLAL